jgi:hypothetical protein
METTMNNAIDTLSTSSPPAATRAEGDSTVFAAFRSWADTVRWANDAADHGDASNNWRAQQIIRCEREISRLTPIDARDLACLSWVALAGLTTGATRADPCGIDATDSDLAGATAAAIKAMHPDIAAILAGDVRTEA